MIPAVGGSFDRQKINKSASFNNRKYAFDSLPLSKNFCFSLGNSPVILAAALPQFAGFSSVQWNWPCSLIDNYASNITV